MINNHIRERLSAKQVITHEGFLRCEAVPIARTGTQVYGPGEIANEAGYIGPGPDGLIYAERRPEDVFRPETIASFEGKPVCMGHPERDVTPHNWRELAAGVVLNPRRGTAMDDDVILADLLITNKDEIEAVRNGLREVSAGYNADYEDLGTPGRVRQYNIIANHLALVPAGRCGPRCSIGDKKTLTEDCAMTWLEKLKAAFAGKDEAAFNAALAEAPKGETVSLTTDQLKTLNKILTRDKEHPDDCDCKACKGDSKTMDAIAKDIKDIKGSVDAIDARVKKMEDAEKEEEEEKKKKETEDEGNRKIEGNLEMEAPPGTGDKAKGAKDSLYLVDSFQETIALAEAIAPGVQVPTVDAKASPKKTFDALCQFRRTVLDLAHAKPEFRQFIDGIAAGRELKSMTCDAVRNLYLAVGGYAKDYNNRRTTSDVAVIGNGGGTGVRGPIKTPADINKRNQEYYSNK